MKFTTVKIHKQHKSSTVSHVYNVLTPTLYFPDLRQEEREQRQPGDPAEGRPVHPDGVGEQVRDPREETDYHGD